MIATDSLPTLQTGAQKYSLPKSATPFSRQYLPDHSVWSEYYKTSQGFLLRFPAVADYTVSFDGRQVSACAAAGVSEPDVTDTFMCEVLPLALSRQARLVLHASAIELGDFAVAFAAASGRGKSALAASFSRRGYRFLTDDCLLLAADRTEFLVEPGTASIQLYRDARNAVIAQDFAPVEFAANQHKSAAGVNDGLVHCDTARPLRFLYFLGQGDTGEVLIEPVNGRDAVAEMVWNCYRLDSEDRELLARQFGQLTALARTVRFFRLDYPRRFDYLPQVREAVLRHVLGQDRPGAA